MDDVSPTLARRMLLIALNQLHEKSGLTTDEVAEPLGVDRTTVARWLGGGKQRLKPHEVDGLCKVYAVDAETAAQLVRLAKEANTNTRGLVQKLPWFARYRFDLFLTLERDSTAIDTFELTTMPGLLQTESYARQVIRADEPQASAEDVAERVKLRMERQVILKRADRPAKLHAVIDEGVIRRTVADEAIMRDQLGHLLDLSRQPNCTIQVIPFATGPLVPSVVNPFVVLHFNQVARVSYEEGPMDARYRETMEDTDGYLRLFQQLAAAALSPEDSADMIAEARGVL